MGRKLVIEERQGHYRMTNESGLDVMGHDVESVLTEGMSRVGVVDGPETADAFIRNLFDASEALDSLMGPA